MDNPNPVADETNPSVRYVRPDGLQAPPRILFYGLIGIFLLGIVGTIAGVLVFRDVLRPAQQERVMGILPFMEAFLPPHPDADDTVPTSVAPVNVDAAQSLLTNPLRFDAAPSATPITESTPEATPEASPTEDELSANPAEIGAPVGGGTEEQQQTAIAQGQPPTMTPVPNPTENINATFAAAQAGMESTQRTWPLTALNTGFTWQLQGWNECGPTTLTIAMSYYGWTQNKDYANIRLKPDREDKNVSTEELTHFVNEYSDIRALWRYGGDLDMLRRLIAAGYPVVIERSHAYEGAEWLGHFQVLAGYDDSQRLFTIVDSWLGQSTDGAPIYETYADVDAGWREFNRPFIVLYPPGSEGDVMNLIGGNRATLEDSAAVAYQVAQEDARLNANDAFAWFNMGTSLTVLGRYEEAKNAYLVATSLEQLPWRIYWYQFGIFEAYYETGLYDDVMALVQTNLSNNGEYVEETFYWQGKVLEAQGDIVGARAAYRRALNFNRFYTDAQEALDALNA